MAKRAAPTQQQLTAVHRTESGSRRIQRMRHGGLVPGVVYGKATKPVAVAISAKALVKALHTQAGEHALLTLTVEADGATKAWEKPVLVKDVQHHPVDGHLLHVDFHAIVMTERLKVKVPVELKGTPIGVKEGGGVLEHFLREVEVECLPSSIPAHVEFDISGLPVGSTVHVRDLAAPADTKITSDPDGVIASVLLPKEEKAEEETAATEPEVITEKKAEAEGEAEAGKKDEKKDDKKDAKGE